jgi:hypothetical protein
MKPVCALLALLLAAGAAAAQPRPAAMPGIAENTAGMEKLAGFFPLYRDAKPGKVWLEIEKWQAEFLDVNSLPAGLGSIRERPSCPRSSPTSFAGCMARHHSIAARGTLPVLTILQIGA